MTSTKRIGPYYASYSGKALYLLDPHPEDFEVEDIAHALSLTNRFGGHSRVGYSVAQHAFLVSYVCKPENAFYGHNHDDSEFVLQDVVSPLKALLPEYQRIEKTWMAVIDKKFGCNGNLISLPQDVKDADGILLVTEKRDLCNPGPPWETPYKPLDEKIIPWSAEVAEKRFLQRFKELYKGR